MKSRYFPFMLGSLFALTVTAPLVVPMTAHAQDEQQDAQASEDAEVLTRGPVHEAFAEAVSYEAEAGMIIKSAPPAAIEELPPDQKPTGDNVTWIPGYWAWDDDQNDFLWISGVWRNIPPERQWVPGYWNDLGDESFQWVSGYWSDNQTDEVEYVQTAPPKSIDSGPNVAAPSDDHSWVPGNWLWNESRYVWRPGYWLELRPNWTWVPARYNWSPRGYAYVDGYWDYAVANRGVLFAPVHFRRNVWASPGYYYTPSIVVSLNLFTDHLWVRPRCNHYYFGDYYAPRYADLGFYAGYSWHRHRRGYDPIWAYDRWEHRRDRDWERRYEDNFNFFRNNDRFRPPHTWAAMRGLGNERLEGGRNRLFASSFSSMVNNPDRKQQFRSLDRERRDQFVAQGKEMRAFSRQRRDLETVKVAAADRAQNGEDRKGVFREKLRRSPVAGRETAQFAKNEGPPKRPEGRGRAALKEAAAANAANPERGKGRDLAQRQGGDSVAPGRGGLAGKGQGQNREGRAQDPSIAQQERGKAQRENRAGDGQAQLKQQQREKATPERQVQPKPQREKATPERQVQPKQQQREKVAPERQVQPKAQPKQQQREKAAPQQREAQPKRQVVPERKAQPQQPQRQAQPRQPQVKPQQNRQAKEKDKAQASVAPQQRRQQANVQRAAAQPKPQVQRQAQPRPQQKAAPKPQARPQVQQRQAQQRPQQQARPQVQQRQAQPRQQQQARPQPQQRQAQPRQQQSRPQQQQQRQNRKDKKDTA